MGIADSILSYQEEIAEERPKITKVVET